MNWKITYVIGNINIATGLEVLTPHVIFAKGFLAAIPGGTIEPTGDGKADITMNLVAIKKIRDGAVLYDINRQTNTIIVNGVRYNTATSLF